MDIDNGMRAHGAWGAWCIANLIPHACANLIPLGALLLLMSLVDLRSSTKKNNLSKIVCC